MTARTTKNAAKAPVEPASVPPQRASENAVKYLRIALITGDKSERLNWLSRSFAALADAVGIETLLSAMRIGAEVHDSPHD